MEKFTAQSLVASTICVLLLMFAYRTIVKAQKIDAKADIVVIVNAFYPADDINLFYAEQKALMDGLAKLPTFFEMSDQKTRFAVVSPMAKADGSTEGILLNLTGNQNTVIDTLSKWRVPGIPLPTGGFQYGVIHLLRSHFLAIF